MEVAWRWCLSAGLLAESRPGQRYIQLLVVLDQGRVAIVQDELPQRRVLVEGLSEAVACGCSVDHTMLHTPVHTARDKTRQETIVMTEGRF